MERWLSELVAGRHAAAWDLFLDRYRALIIATIKRMIADRDDAMDLFGSVCQLLWRDDCARLKRLADADASPSSYGPWVVAVVRNHAIDWIRKQAGRRRHPVLDQLTPLQQRIYQAVAVEGWSCAEAYELIKPVTNPPISYRGFLREVRETHRLAPFPAAVSSRPVFVGPPSEDVAPPMDEGGETTEMSDRLNRALESLAPDVRLAVQLFVVERLSAADVANAVGWQNPKAVYNKVSRALATLRVRLEREGVSRDDLS